jgi:NADPH2:quinone reductase
MGKLCSVVMRAAMCRAYGPPETVIVEDVPAPEPGPGEVLVDVRAAAVNFPDVLLLANQYQVSVPVPFTPGSELAGEVVAVGDGVIGLGPGDRVFGTVMVGAFAEQVVLPAGSVSPIPEGLDFRAAAAFGVAYATAYHSLRSVAAVEPGEWVVVLGAAGGVGLAAVELAQVLGGRVVAAASSAEKLQLCRDRGAEQVIDYTSEDLRLRIREVTDGAADVVIDPVGGAWSEQALRSVRWGGRFVTVGFASGDIPRIPLNLVLLKGVIVKGFEMRGFMEHAPEAAARDRAELGELLASGRARPHVGAVFPLSDVAGALQSVADRKAMGKVIVDVKA